MITTPAVLITIPLSHYCEKARWGLDRVALPYREEPHAPLLHRLATMRNDGGTVPVLAHHQLRLIDSNDILVHADAARGGDVLYPRDAAHRHEVEEWVRSFDTVLGPHTRRWAYAHLLTDKPLLRSLWSQAAPKIETTLLAALAPLARRLVRATYNITPKTAQHSLDRVRGIFQQVGQRLADSNRFLVGDKFTAADLTFASLAAPVVLPPEYRGVQPAIDAVGPAMREEILRFRNTDAGRFALRLFSEERDRVVPTV